MQLCVDPVHGVTLIQNRGRHLHAAHEMPVASMKLPVLYGDVCSWCGVAQCPNGDIKFDCADLCKCVVM